MTDPDRTAKARAFWLGRIATFQPSPDSKARHAGQIIRVDPAPDYGPTAIPNFTLVVRGRSGKTASVDLCIQYASIFPQWPEAITDTNQAKA